MQFFGEKNESSSALSIFREAFWHIDKKCLIIIVRKAQ